MTQMPTDPTIPDYGRPTERGSWLTQTAALAVDAYRQVNAQRLFWITMVLNVMAVLTFAIPGIDAQGVYFPFGLRLDFGLSTAIMTPGLFYKYLYTAWAIPIWLTWVAVVLALISTANIFPDLINAGAVDLYLSKPLGRLRLFLTKYFFGLTFAALQVAVFSLAGFLAIGLRGGVWAPGLFWAIPVVTIFFSYLFCVSALLGVLFRSTLAAMLLTLLLWFALFVVNAAETSLLTFRAKGHQERTVDERLVAANEKLIASNRKAQAADGVDRSTMTETIRLTTKRQKEAMADRAANLRRVEVAYAFVSRLRLPLPKTTETADLMRRWLVGSADLPNADPDAPNAEVRTSRRNPDGPPLAHLNPDSPSVQAEVRQTLDARGVGWVLGTSLAFEAAVLALAAWIFARRDY